MFSLFKATNPMKLFLKDIETLWALSNSNLIKTSQCTLKAKDVLIQVDLGMTMCVQENSPPRWIDRMGLDRSLIRWTRIEKKEHSYVQLYISMNKTSQDRVKQGIAMYTVIKACSLGQFNVVDSLLANHALSGVSLCKLLINANEFQTVINFAAHYHIVVDFSQIRENCIQYFASPDLSGEQKIRDYQHLQMFCRNLDSTALLSTIYGNLEYDLLLHDKAHYSFLQFLLLEHLNSLVNLGQTIPISAMPASIFFNPNIIKAISEKSSACHNLKLTTRECTGSSFKQSAFMALLGELNVTQSEQPESLVILLNDKIFPPEKCWKLAIGNIKHALKYSKLETETQKLQQLLRHFTTQSAKKQSQRELLPLWCLFRRQAPQAQLPREMEFTIFNISQALHRYDRLNTKAQAEPFDELSLGCSVM